MIIEMKLRSPSVCLPVEFVSFSALRGETGLRGEKGVGVPEGGKKGQVLKKSGDGDFETEWSDDIAGQGGTIVTVGGVSQSKFAADEYVQGKIDESIGEIGSALDEVHEYAQAIINGGAI